jgi:hypothetical protein
LKPGTSATTAPAAGSPPASPSFLSDLWASLKQYVAWPLVVAGAGWLFAVYAGVHVLDYLGVSGWLAWKGVEALWLTAAIAGYLALVMVEHETTQAAIKWTVWGMFLTGSLGYAWHDGQAKADAQNAAAYFRAAYANAECQRVLAKYEDRKPLTLIVPTALPPKDEVPAIKPVDVPGKVVPTVLHQTAKRRPTSKTRAVSSPFAN